MVMAVCGQMSLWVYLEVTEEIISNNVKNQWIELQVNNYIAFSRIPSQSVYLKWLTSQTFQAQFSEQIIFHIWTCIFERKFS